MYVYPNYYKKNLFLKYKKIFLFGKYKNDKSII